MIPRVRGVGVALVVMLAVAPVRLAAQEMGYLPGKAGIGGGIGVSYFRLDQAFGSDWFSDYSAGAESRFSFAGQFRYIFTPHLRIQVSPGFTWAAYSRNYRAPFSDPNFPAEIGKGSYLTLVVPVSAQAQFVVKRGWWLYHAGAGPGIYRVWVENHRKVVKDPVTLKLHRGVYPGGSAEFGAERFLKSLTNTSIEGTFAGHLALAQDNERFVAGFNSNLLVLEARVGVNYYFNTAVSQKKATEPLPSLSNP